MWGIFEKKEWLIDHINGMTDIHNHILPGIDDGAANIEESVELLIKFRQLGISSFIATPHIMNDYYPNTPQTIKSSLELLKDSISTIADLKTTQIKAAAEYMMDQNFLEILETDNLLPLKEKFLLVEMSYFQAPINLKEILFQLQTNGYRPILAHPERYAYYHTKDLRKYEDLKARGCKFQINALSLTPHYGTNMQKIAFALLERGMIDYIGTDTHRMKHLEKIEEIKIPSKILAPLKKVIANTRDLF